MKTLPKCKVCFQEFTLKGPSPYLLPCLHAVCETCVTSTAGGVISCSTCQREVNLTRTHLQKDVVRQREIFHLTVQHRPSELLCTHEDDDNEAVIWCQDCEELLCEYCQTQHESFKATRKHIIKDIGQLSHKKTDRELYCSDHNNYPLDSWDKDCCILICGRCQREDHVNHQVADIDKAYVSARAEIEALQREVNLKAETQKAALRKTREQFRCTPDFTTISENISHTVSSLKNKLDQIEKEAIIDLEQHTENTVSNLQSLTKFSQTACNRCDITSDYIDAAVHLLSKTELLPLKKTIRETTQSCLTSLPLLQQPKPASEVLRQLKDRISKACNTTTTGNNQGDRIREENDPSPAGEKEAENLRQKRPGFPFWTAVVCIASLCVIFGIVSQSVNISGDPESCGPLKTVAKEAQEKLEECQHLLTKARNEERKMKTYLKKQNLYVQRLEQNLTSVKTKMEQLSHDLEIATTKREVKSKKQKENHGGRKKAKRELISIWSSATILYMSYVESLKQELDQRNYPKALDNTDYGMAFDRLRVNCKMTHINERGNLVNEPSTLPTSYPDCRFRVYEGSRATFSLQTSETLYWEVRVRVYIRKPLPLNHLLLEIAFCTEKDIDIMPRVPDHPHTISLAILYCYKYGTFCTGIRKNGYWVSLLPIKLSNSAGSRAILNYGVLIDHSRSRLAFTDVNSHEIISDVISIDTTDILWPMFGVFNQEWASVEMKLVVGNDIRMTDQMEKFLAGIMS